MLVAVTSYTAAAYSVGAEDLRQAQVPVQIPAALPPGADVVPTPDPSSAAQKIHFDVSGFTSDGLYGPADGLRSLAYEFCIPARPEVADEVRAIDPTVQVFAGSPGRTGCNRDEYLCIGNTHQPNFEDVLLNLAELDYVESIEPSFAE